MNILSKLHNNSITNKEIVDNLSKNPIVSFHLFTYIVNNKILDKDIFDKIIELTHNFKSEDKILGNYTLGHLAIAALIALKIEHIENLGGALSEFDKKMAYKFLESTEWKY